LVARGRVGAGARTSELARDSGPPHGASLVPVVPSRRDARTTDDDRAIVRLVSTMNERPAAIVLDDLASPRYPPEVVPVLDALAEYGATVSLEPAQLCEHASEQTALGAWGDDDF